MWKRVASIVTSLVFVGVGTAAELKPIERRLPPKGINLLAADLAPLRDQFAQLEDRLARLKQQSAQANAALHLLPDAESYIKAVDLALRYGEFYRKGDVDTAKQTLAVAAARLDDIEAGRTPWANQRGLVVRGYRSDIDGSAQPYGLDIPETLDLSKPVPLYVWLHGRGDNQTDLHFIHERSRKPSQLRPDNAIVLHPFGRQCIGFKSAGEIDVLDAIEHVKSQYKIDADRIVLAGFSMGGAGAWHIGAHYADRFCAVHAGAGFVDVQRYQKVDPATLPWYEVKLWGQYDVPDYVRNLFNCPVIAYSGELDKQKAAADIMAEAFTAQGRELRHIIGPQMGHKYDPESLKTVMAFLDEAVRKGRERTPKQVHLQTRTLRYHRMHWVQIISLERHWSNARVDAQLIKPRKLGITTQNVTSLILKPDVDMAGGEVEIDGQLITLSNAPHVLRAVAMSKVDGKWIVSLSAAGAPGLAKRPGLQGPIDDAFMAPFLVVRPTGRSAHPDVQRWVEFELTHFEDRWRSVFRGELRIKDDKDITPDDIDRYHLVLFGDPASNAVLAKVIGKLPIKWTNESSTIGDSDKQYASASHVPLMIYPNPLNERRYIVLNSGPTFRESHDRTNSLQNPKMPDWAVIDLSQPPDDVTPGRVADAGFFDDNWRWQAEANQGE